MEINPTRIGKVAITAAITTREEEEFFKQYVADKLNFRMAITFVSGARTDVVKSFVKSIIACALQGKVIRNQNTEIHGVIHAGLECLNCISSVGSSESSLKLKIAIVSDGRWVAVAAHGESAFHPDTNHERMGFGIMHI